MAIFGNKGKSGAFTINFASVAGTPLYDNLNAISVNLLDDKIEFKQRIGKKEPIYLNYSQVTGFGEVKEEQIIEQEKSVLGRAAVGGLLLGPLGAMIGAIDGTSKKKSTIKKIYFIINYISKDGEEQALPLEIVGATVGLRKFADQLKVRCPNLKVELPLQDNNHL